VARSTLFIASSTASAEDKARADYTCDGTADDVQIQAAIGVLKAAGGGAVLLSPGTFKLNARIVIDGGGNVDVEQDIAIYGCGPSNSILDATASGLVSGVHLTGSCKVHLHNFGVNVQGSTHGISSAGTLTSTADYRSFWHSSFKNLEIVGDWSAHTGYGLHLGSPFRSVFENIEIGGCGNGIRIFSENTNFNPGDCTFQRIFCDLVGNSHRAYSIESTTADGNMNQMEFIMCEAITDGTGCTAIYLGGTGPVNHCKFHGINLEQFDTFVNFNSGEGNVIDGNYWELRGSSGLNGLVYGSGATDNEVSRVGMWYVGTACNMFSKAGGSATQPNTVEKVAFFLDGAAASLGFSGPANTPGTDTLLRKRISNGGGTSAGSNVLFAPGAVTY
jgi:hypothetical protein